MRVACLFSGGKDSTMARHRAVRAGHDVACLVNLVPASPEAWLFHSVALELVPLQAELLGDELVRADVGEGEDAELAGLREVLADLDVDGLVTGGRRSRYQQSRFDGICDELGLEPIHPLWEVPAGDVLAGMAADWDVRIVSVAAEGLGPEWLGRRLDEAALEELVGLAKEHRFHPDGEGGEFETAVLAGPDLDGRITWEIATRWDGRSGRVQVESAETIQP